jgi:hypothetical protein
VKLLAALADRVLNILAPLPNHWLAAEAAARQLAAAEQSRDSWEKGELNNFPPGWQDQLHDAVAFNDDDDTLDPSPRPASASSRGGADPAGTGPLSPVPAGAPLHPAVIISRTFRQCGVAVPAAAAEIVAIELTNFYNLTPKK